MDEVLHRSGIQSVPQKPGTPSPKANQWLALQNFVTDVPVSIRGGISILQKARTKSSTLNHRPKPTKTKNPEPRCQTHDQAVATVFAPDLLLCTWSSLRYLGTSRSRMNFVRYDPRREALGFKVLGPRGFEHQKLCVPLGLWFFGLKAIPVISTSRADGSPEASRPCNRTRT